MTKIENRAKSVKCVRDARKLDYTVFRLPTDGRKWKAVAKERRALYMELASYADGDGTGACPSIESLMRVCGSRSTTFRRLDDLKKLGRVVDGKKSRYQGTKYRSILLSVSMVSDSHSNEPETASIQQDDLMVSDSNGIDAANSVSTPMVSDSTVMVSDRVPMVSSMVTHNRPIIPTSKNPLPEKREGGVGETQVHTELQDKLQNQTPNYTNQNLIEETTPKAPGRNTNYKGPAFICSRCQGVITDYGNHKCGSLQ